MFTMNEIWMRIKVRDLYHFISELLTQQKGILEFLPLLEYKIQVFLCFVSVNLRP